MNIVGCLWISIYLEQQYENVSLNIFVLLGMEGISSLPLKEIIVIRNVVTIKVKIQEEAKYQNLLVVNVRMLKVLK